MSITGRTINAAIKIMEVLGEEMPAITARPTFMVEKGYQVAALFTDDAASKAMLVDNIVKHFVGGKK